ncbi:MAG: VanW family protein [Deltaproteobacteria bacterium]|nr:VanW family protein [Deltaproteobacteria bacterium]
MIKRPKFIPKPISTYHSVLYKLAVGFRKFERHLNWLLSSCKFADKTGADKLKYRVKKHQSVLIRKSKGIDLKLQENKVENLKIVINRLNGVIINPGETFSFWKLVGKPTKRRGFKMGMELSCGEAREGIGGGICQVSNLIYWLILHSPLKVAERHHHSFDPFPDNGRVLPFASGATVMYNYKDFQFKNCTPYKVQLNFWLDKKCINGEIRASELFKYSYSVYEEKHFFEKVNGNYFRSNQLWRRVIDKENGGMTIDHEYIVTNYAEVKYTPDLVS